MMETEQLSNEPMQEIPEATTEPVESPEPIVVNTIDYTGELQAINMKIEQQQESIVLVENAIAQSNEISAGIYTALLFTIGVAVAVGVLVVLNNFIRKCY